MSHDTEIESRLIGDIYDAALEPRLWNGVVERIARLTHAEKANVLAFDRLNPDYFLFHSHGTSQDDLERYQIGGFAALDMDFAGKWLQQEGGFCQAVANHRHFGDIETYKRAAGPLYRDFFAPTGILYQCGGLLEKTDFRWSVVGVHRGPDGTPFGDEDIATVSRLMPHLRRSLQIHRQLANARPQDTPLHRLLDGLTVGVLLLDDTQRVRYANSRAESLLRQHDGLQVGPRHDLRAQTPARQTELQALLHGAIRTSQRTLSDAAGGVLACPDSQDDGVVMLTVVPLSRLSGCRELGNEGIGAAIFLSDPYAQHRLATGLLKRAYDLTDRESAIC
ncbi:MAG TPA: PAS domain-containing protein, partial [Moraxellaceae bacterium]|nr:PAS domain-containing protein [Moraxellaceae bacterium]